MIFGIGTDLTEVDRIAEKLSRNSAFKVQLFAASEIDYCENCSNPAESYAARFAAKEAFLKATGLGLTLGHDLRDIVVGSDPLGKPSMKLVGAFAKLQDEYQWKKIHLTMSHVKTIACAMVIIEQ